VLPEVLYLFVYPCKLIKMLQMIPIGYRDYSNAEICNLFINKQLYNAQTHSVLALKINLA